MSLNTYRTLGRSGLRVSRLALGAATFGTEWGWGVERAEARALFDHYVERGGNVIDTADTYTEGTSERMVGEFARSERQSLVLATKYTTLSRPADPNSAGSHRKNLRTAVEGSLQRLQTDYVDLLYLHVWDALTPVEEVLRGMDDLVRAGKVLYVAMSTAPAWQVSRMQTLADVRGWSPLVALQIEYNLIQRGGESDLIPMANELGLGVVPFSPLAGGVLSGKYSRADLAGPGADDGSRKNFNAAIGGITERNLTIADTVQEIAHEVGSTSAQVALAWLLQNPAITMPIVGARTIAQLDENLGALDVELTAAQLTRLHEVSAPQLPFPYDVLASDHIRAVTRGDLTIEARR